MRVLYVNFFVSLLDKNSKTGIEPLFTGTCFFNELIRFDPYSEQFDKKHKLSINFADYKTRFKANYSNKNSAQKSMLDPPKLRIFFSFTQSPPIVKLIIDMYLSANKIYVWRKYY